MVSAGMIKDLNHPQITYHKGPLTNQTDSVLPPEKARTGSLVFVSLQSQVHQAQTQGATILVALNKLNLDDVSPSLTVFTTPHVQMAMAMILPFFGRTTTVWEQEPKISPLAFIHPSARLGPDVVVQAFAWIGSQVILGGHCRIGANSVIQDRSLVGQNTIIHPQVFIGTDTEIGVDCEIHSHSSIGAPGFGFASTNSFQHHHIPQIGRVVLGDRVRIGANCNIDRSTLTETRIGSGTKIDAHCHIAHNCEVGEDSLIAAGFFTAGSTIIGRRFVTGGGSVTSDHLRIADDVLLAGRSTVTNDISAKGQYGGYPLQPLKDALKTLATLPHLVSMRKQLAKLTKDKSENASASETESVD